MGLCSNSQSLVVSQQLRVCDARNDAGSAVHRLGKNLATCPAAGWGEFCPKINLTTVQYGVRIGGESPAPSATRPQSIVSWRHVD